MKEILINSISDIYFNVFKNGVLTDATGSVLVSIFKNEVKIVDSALATKVSDSTGKYSYTVPISAVVDADTIDIVTEEGELQFDWSVTIGSSVLTIKEYYQVVSPYSPWAYFNDANVKYLDYLECERISRYIINSYCGQEFGKKKTTYAIEGQETNSLKMPSRLITLENVTYFHPSSLRPGNIIGYGNSSWEIATDGWSLRLQPSRTTIDPVWMNRGFFKRNTLYNIKGLWGYNVIPGPVEEASKILIANFLCADHKYRDKYLSSIKMGDWDVTFHDQAFAGTGDATVDRLLSDHRNYVGIGFI